MSPIDLIIRALGILFGLGIFVLSIIFGGLVLMTIIGFLIFWSLLSWFFLSAFGLMFYRRQQLFAQVVPKNMSLDSVVNEKKNEKTSNSGPVKGGNEWVKARKRYQAQ